MPGAGAALARCVSALRWPFQTQTCVRNVCERLKNLRLTSVNSSFLDKSKTKFKTESVIPLYTYPSLGHPGTQSPPYGTIAFAAFTINPYEDYTSVIIGAGYWGGAGGGGAVFNEFPLALSVMQRKHSPEDGFGKTMASWPAGKEDSVSELDSSPTRTKPQTTDSDKPSMAHKPLT